MTYSIWRLSEASPDSLGLSCTNDGLLLGRTPLIERRDGRFAVRERDEIRRLLQNGYQREPGTDGLMSGLATVARALNANDLCLARIAAVHLKLPDLKNAAARESLEAEDNIIKAANVGAIGRGREEILDKASPDDPKHPGWPAGTPGGRGGKFRPKDGSAPEISNEAKNRILRLAACGALRLAARAILRLGAEAAANLVPILDIVADAALALDAANTISEFWKLTIDAKAALDFANNGPYSLEQLQVSSNEYQEFSSYSDFVKGELMLDLISKMFGSAGDGYQYHHIVTQGGANEDNTAITSEQLQNTDNIIRLPTLLHQAVNAEYQKRSSVAGMNIYQWAQTQPYDVQREIGLGILRDLNILK